MNPIIQKALSAIRADSGGSIPPGMAAATKSLPAKPPAATAYYPGKPAAGASGMDIDNAVNHLNASYLPPSGRGRCAQHVRQAIEAGGVKLDANTRPLSAKDYGPYLETHGFKKIPTKDHLPEKGDIIVLQGFPEGPIDPGTGKPEYQASEDGHITMFNGEKWGSDFEQEDFWGGTGYQSAKPAHAIYRP